MAQACGLEAVGYSTGNSVALMVGFGLGGIAMGKLADRERRSVDLAEVYPNPLPDPAAR